jgi:hypothetical protein
MKKGLAILTSCLIIASSIIGCKKNDDSPYSKTITGVNLTAIDAAPAGSLGVPDIKTYSSRFMMFVYPTPCTSLMQVGAVVDNETPVTLTAKLVHVIYNGAPKDITIENKDLAGQVALTLVKNLETATPDNSSPVSGIGSIGAPTKGQHIVFAFDVSNLPQGFYRVYIESDKGDVHWDNTWIKR